MKIDTDKVRKQMEALEITEGDLAELMDTSRQMINMVLNGERGKTLKYATRLAEILKFEDPRDILLVE